MKVKGFQVAPAELEGCLLDHAAVSDACVVGVPDERWGEVCIAFVAVRTEVAEEELLDFCRERLARYKVPKAVRFLDVLPRNSLGKVEKNGLGELVA